VLVSGHGTFGHEEPLHFLVVTQRSFAFSEETPMTTVTLTGLGLEQILEHAVSGRSRRLPGDRKSLRISIHWTEVKGGGGGGGVRSNEKRSRNGEGFYPYRP
jgi:hypothetical protein